MAEWIDLTEENIDSEHLCCIIRSRKPHPGVEMKRDWLRERLAEGHVFRKLDAKGCCFIEYAPVEKAWVPVVGEGFYYIYCLWVDGAFKHHGYGRELMECCLKDVKQKGGRGVCMLGAKKQKNWLSNQAFGMKYGMEAVDETADGYQLLALSFDGSRPAFTDKARAQRLDDHALTIFYSPQCPHILQRIEGIRVFCAEKQVPLRLEPVDTLEKAKALPCVFNNFGAFWQGRFITVNLMDPCMVAKLPNLL